MQIGMIGLGRMGADMTRRLLAGGHECVVFDLDEGRVRALERAGATGASSVEALVGRLARPRTVWLMVPAGAVDRALADLAPRLEADDVVVDGGNTNPQDDRRRAARLEERGIHHVDCGTSGGVWGREGGYCLMVGGDDAIVSRLDPLFRTLAPGRDAAPPTAARAARSGTAEDGYLHCGPHGAGHFVKMVHNGIEYGVMAAYAEGLALLGHAAAGLETRETDAETTPLRDPGAYAYRFELADVAEVWRRGSVIRSWLLDLAASALARDPGLEAFAGRVSDSGEGRWALQAAIDVGAPAPVLATALFARFASRGEADYAGRLLSAMRHEFGGHQEKGPGR